MNVMLLYSTRSFEQELDRACLKNAFSSSGGTVRDFDAGEPFTKSDVAGVDIVICLNKKAFACAVRLSPFNKPLVYVTRSSDAISEYVSDWRLADRIVIIKDTRNVRHFYPQEMVTVVAGLYNGVSLGRESIMAENSKNDLLFINDIAASRSSSFFALLKAANESVSLFDAKVAFITRIKVEKSLFHPGIDLIKPVSFSQYRENAEQAIAASQIIVGQGPFLASSLLMGKDCIVAGACGYGGRITMDNLKFHFNEGFSGRPGGSEGEPIPEKLLLYEINELSTDIFEKKMENRNELKMAMSRTVEMVFRQITDIAFSLVSGTSVAENLQQRYQLSSLYEFREIDNELSSIISKVSGKVLFKVDRTERQTIECFLIPKSPAAVIDEYKTSIDEKILYDFIMQLYKEKIILPCED